MRAPIRLAALLALALPWPPAAASAQEEPRLALDIAPGPATPNPPYPSELTAFRGALFFAGRSPLTGGELFRTDGTEEGTRVVADLCSGRCSSNVEGLVVAGDHLYFQACDPARGCKLWSSDGTEEGTVALSDYPFYSAFPASWYLVSWKGQAAYVTSGGQLFVSDGTVEGTRFVADLSPGPRSFLMGVAAGPSKIYVLFSHELWVSDGEGAERILSLPDRYLYGKPLAVGDRLFFAEQGEEPALWTSDGTVESTRLVQRTAEPPSLRFAAGDRAYFVIQEYGAGTTRSTLYTSDATAAGTQPVAGVPPTQTYTGNFSYDAAHHLGQSYFVRREEEGVDPRSGLWRLQENGTAADRIAEFDGRLTAVSDGALLYLATELPSRLYRSYGPAWSISLLHEWDDAISEFTPVGRRLFLRTGASLGSSDGTVEGTGRLDLFRSPPSADPERLADHGGKLLFSSRPLQRGGWTDGTSGGTMLFGEWELTGISAVGRAFFFNSRTFSSSLSVLEQDGELTRLFDYGTFPESASEQNGRFFFLVENAVAGAQLWTSDGTVPGTEIIKDEMGELGLACPSYCLVPPLAMVGLGERFYFPLMDVVWSSDGTTGGTNPALRAEDLCWTCIHSLFGDLVRFRDRLAFFLTDGLFHYLLTSDGSVAGSELVAQFEAPGPFPGPLDPFEYEDLVPVVAGDQMFFSLTTADEGFELWRSDGSSEGTRRVRDILPGPRSSRPREMHAFGGRLYFVADDGVHGLELWTSDGSQDGTRLVADLRPGPDPSFPRDLAVAAGRLFFAADDGVHGLEPWTIDAPGSAPRLLSDVAPGAGSSSPRDFVRAGSSVYFNAGTPEAGFELWSLDLGVELFRDGFESGDTSAWSHTTN